MPELSERLDGKVALVTGAASGIGAACAALLRERGADVLGTDIAPGADFVHDVTSEAAWDAAIAETVARHGRLDILVSNAGTASSGPIVDLTLAEFRRHSRVHVEGAFLGVKAAAARTTVTAWGPVRCSPWRGARRSSRGRSEVPASRSSTNSRRSDSSRRTSWRRAIW